MTAHNIQQWLRCTYMAESCAVTIHVGDMFKLYRKDGLTMGSFDTVDQVLNFLTGYEQGIRERDDKKDDTHWNYTGQ